MERRSRRIAEEPPAVLASGLQIGPACPTDLAEALRAGRPLLLQARYSTPSGSTAYTAVADNLRRICKQLAASGVFPNLDRLVPDTRELSQALRGSTDVDLSREASGTKFANRYLSFASRHCASVWLHLSCGSGYKIDDATIHQPAVKRAAESVRAINPAAVCAAEISRWSREPYALHPWIYELERVADRNDGVCFVSRNGEVPRRWEQNLRHVFFYEAEAAGQEARLMRQRTSAAVRARFPIVAVDGVAAYPISQAPPPPLATAWRRTADAPGRGEHIVFPDCPAARALLGPGVYGAPEVLGPDGTPVDQVALVRFYLCHRGLPDWPAKRLALHMAVGNFSSEGLRHQRGSLSASWADRPLSRHDRWAILDSIERNLDFLADGVLWLRLGDRGTPEPIRGLLPPDGLGYASPADLARLRDLRETHRTGHTRARRYTFGNLPVTANRATVRLIGVTEPGFVGYVSRRDTDHRSPRSGLAASPDRPR